MPTPPALQVDTLVVSLFESNCHLLRAPGSTDVLVIDPGDDAPEIAAHLDHAGLQVSAYLLTHGHVDHVSALADLVARRPAPVAMHPRDACWAFSPAAAMPPYYDAPRPPPAIDRELAEGQLWTDAGLTYRVLETPGHSPGGVAFYFEHAGTLIAGDTLFRGSVGRADLPGANPADLVASLKKLMALPDATLVYCGHGPATTIGEEKRHNPYLRSFAWAE
ncbi:MAG TPA: MBL fold metallo-hydrolase [Kiritimatiellia bacterium]|nr:MBL fold metallo-hydrolase [Kiritimatiellia bacterium]HMP35268.1 MBL fold metallo-hydrolase [Kiritimatiellia bacterium]